ncbi:unnamed protein product [Anisakis simplex]|uniref:ABC transporter ATP-binding protein n=1 Tax=Anisakis simplex TaxID=6269 RepID=A0A0M3JLF9_ANISI|nr:unnamed protein product [Anisakis simplex]
MIPYIRASVSIGQYLSVSHSEFKSLVWGELIGQLYGMALSARPLSVVLGESVIHGVGPGEPFPVVLTEVLLGCLR